jgi:uncharacterized protein (DUF1684 family)
MKRLIPLLILIVIVTAGVVMMFRLRARGPSERAPVIPESLPPAPDLDSLPGDTLYFGEIEKHRARAREFLAGDNSPLDEGDRATFTGLNYYPPDPAYRLRVRLEAPARHDTVTLLDTQGAERKYVRQGILRFRIDEHPETLTVFREPFQNYLFLPFRDTTSGNETYAVGRYVEPIEAGSNTFIIDFNRAYNPYCAYSHRWACPIPPEENQLSVAIRAGEKKYHLD